MADYKDIFKSVDSQNWLKVSFAVEIARQSLLQFCNDEIAKLHSAITSTLPPGPACNGCKLSEVIPYSNENHRCKRPCNCPPKPCPHGVCCSLRKAVEKEHRFQEISWNYTNLAAWRTDSWEIAKCYLPPDGYNSKTAKDIDFNGVISLITNNKKIGSTFSFSNLQAECKKVSVHVYIRSTDL